MKVSNILSATRSIVMLLACWVITHEAMAQNKIQGHEYVDLGLPSGTIWATCNIGAESPEQYGEYYAWGEIAPKSRYDWHNYQHGSWGSNNKISAYGKADGKFSLSNTNDAAYQRWGDRWSVPSKQQFSELLDWCSWQKTKLNGILCLEGKGPNGNKIILPYAGAMNYTDCEHAGNYGTYWTNEVNSSETFRGKVFFMCAQYSVPELWDNSGLRYIGNSIRAVSRLQNGILESGYCGNSLRYAIYDDFSMKIEGMGDFHKNDNGYWSQIKTVSLPDGVSSIGSNSFRSSNLTSIVLPHSVYYIYDLAFADCNHLTSMYVGPTPPTCSQNSEPFKGITQTCTLYVPAGSINSYRQAYGWKEFEKIVEYTDASRLNLLDNVLYLEDAELKIGQQYTMSVKMKNNVTDLTAASFVIQLPEGVSIAKDENDEYMISLNTNRVTSSHTPSINVEKDGKLRVMIVSLMNKLFKGTDGTLIDINLNVAPNAPSGQHQLTLQDVTLTQSNNNKIATANYQGNLSIYDYQMGDVNHDGNITISDVIGVINLWLTKDVIGVYPKHADVNGDGKINISDIVRITEMVSIAEF